MHLRHATFTNASWVTMDADDVEQRIIRGDIQLAWMSGERNGSRTVTVARFGGLEVRLTEVPLEEVPPDMPSFWLEVYSHANACVIDSCGCREFDERELAAAVDLIMRARQRAQYRQ